MLREYRPSILVVADAKELRDASERGLSEAGFHVYVTDQGRSAVAFLRETTEPPDLVVADTDLSDMRALDVAAAASRRGAKVVPLSSRRFRPNPIAMDGVGFDLPVLTDLIGSMLGTNWGNAQHE